MTSIRRIMSTRAVLIAGAVAAVLAAASLPSPAHADPGVVVDIPVGQPANYLAVDPVGDIVYVTTGNTLQRIDGASDAVVASVPVTSAADVVFDPASGRVFVASGTSILVFDGTTLAPITTITTALPFVSWLAIDEAHSRLYASSPGDPRLAVADLSGTTSQLLPIGAASQGLAVNAVTGDLYVANHAANTITVVDTASGPLGAVVGTLPANNYPFMVVVNESTNTVYVGDDGASTVVVIDGATRSVRTTFTTSASNVQGLAVDEASNVLMVGDSGTGNVEYVDGTTGAALYPPLPTTAFVWEMQFNPASQKLYLAGQFSRAVTVVTDPPRITSSAAATATRGAPFSLDVTATGSAPVTFSITAGSLPPGVSLDASSGLISGTPTTPGTYTFTVTASNLVGTDSQEITLVIAAAATPLVATGAPLGDGVVTAAVLLAVGAVLLRIRSRSIRRS